MDVSQPEGVVVGTSENNGTSQVQDQLAVGNEPIVATSIPPPELKTKKPKALPNAERLPGKSLLPISRVQRIMKADKELPSCSKEAVFLISVATEEFIKRLGQASQQQASRDKRATVQRKDVVTAVRRADEFVFLEELLSAGVPAPPPAPAKRKQGGNTILASDTLNIKDAFGKGRGKVDLHAVVSEDEGSSHQAVVDVPSQQEDEAQEEDDDSMDVS